jgi:preprotein translocase subunit SecD
MNANIGKRALVTLAVVVVFLYGIFGVPTSLDSLRKNMAENIPLGLDLKGGTHLVMQVNVNDAINSESDLTMERLQQTLTARQLTYAAMTRIDAVNLLDEGGFTIEGVPTEQTSAFREAVETTELNWLLTPEAGGYRMNLRTPVVNDLRTRAVAQSVETIRNRIDSLGVTEPTIQERGQGSYEILIQLPGVDDPQRVKDILQTTAMLEIKLVQGGPFPQRQDALSANGGVLPAGTEVLESLEVGADGSTSALWYLVTRVPAVSGRELRDARPSRDQYNKPSVGFTLTSDGARRFGEFTEENIGKPLAVVLDKKIKTVATIQSRIADSGQITGRFTQQYANDLSMVLRAGARPASMDYLEERTVGPSLGADSIRAGVMASLVGLTAITLFMLIYYKGAGINAVMALLLNLIVLLGALGFAHATLTLPGIAGVILTIGMAVDANVLVFERIREELRAGKTAVSAVAVGFEKALVTIIDTNATTIISAFFLFIFGSGPVRGFAVTLTIGLLANLFTAVFVSRLMFDYILSRSSKQATLSI